MVIGAVFFVSGSLKIIDPVGTGLIVAEYLNFFHLDVLAFASNWIGAIIATIETFTGAMMMFGIWRKFSYCLASSIILIFTIITAILLIFNPEMDCGCFGEAVHLTHFQSFIKNIVLCVLAAVSLFPFDLGKPLKKRKYVGFGLLSAAVFALFLYSQTRLPLIDFTEFKPGTELLAAQDEYDFIGEEDDVPLNVSVLSISDAFGEYQDWILADGEVMVVSVYAPEKMSARAWGNASAILQNAQYEGMLPVLLCSSMDNIPVELSDLVYFADYKSLITLNRSNGGSTYLNDGRIIEKWSWRNMPDSEQISEFLGRDSVEVMMSDSANKRLALQCYFLLAIIALLIL